MRRKFRRHFLLYLLPRRVCVACVQVREGSLRAIEQSSAALERDDRVIERRLVRTVGDRVDLLQFFAHSDLDRGHKMFILDLVERRVVIGQRAFDREWIVVKIGGGHGGDLRKTEQCATEDAKSMWHSGGVELTV